MPQTIILGVVLGRTKTGLAIGYRILKLDGSVYSPFTTTNVVETANPGEYQVTAPVNAPVNGGSVVWGVAGTDYVSGLIDQAPNYDNISLLKKGKGAMAQKLNLGVVLGRSKTGLTVGYRILNLSGSTYAPFTTVGVTETTNPGEYKVATPVSAPSTGGSIVWGISGTDFVTDTFGATIDISNITHANTKRGNLIEVWQSDTWRFTLSHSEMELGSYESIGFVVKNDPSHSDNNAVLYVRNGSDGLIRIAGAAPTMAGNATLTIDSDTQLSVIVSIDETPKTQPGFYMWYLKGFDETPGDDEGYTIAIGKFYIKKHGLQAVS